MNTRFCLILGLLLPAALASVLTDAAFGQPSGDAAVAIDDKARASAETIFGRYDKDNSGILEEAEWNSMLVKPNDYDGDTQITKDELARTIAAGRAARNGNSASASNSEAASTTKADADAGEAAKPNGDDAAAEPDSPRPSAGATTTETASTSTRPAASDRKRRTTRFLSPRERLPSGLPSFFASSDRDGDGQVMMHEFASRWTEDKVREFAQYDRNNDGVITAAECLRQPRRD